MQSFVVLALDRATNVFVPCVFSLMSGRSEYFFGADLSPSVAAVNFEIALLGAVRYEFHRSRV
ncbi:hypothetical protein HZS_4208 [Henneguya salminicola]|nr:hypothetical protein HZS_4208 [Henneguya salminicola]